MRGGEGGGGGRVGLVEGAAPSEMYTLSLRDSLPISFTGQFFDFTNQNAFEMFYNWGAVPNCITGSSFSLIDFGAGPMEVMCPNTPYLSLVSSTFMHGGLIHLGGNLLFLWIFGDKIGRAHV